jgi:hypothetical protein
MAESRLFMKKLIVLALASVMVSTFSFGHDAPTSNDGCHNDKANKGFHCHDEKRKSNQDAKNIKVKEGLVAGDFDDATTNNKAFVAKAQMHLNNLGYKSGLVTGDINPKTTMAIKLFEKNNKLAEIGMLTPDIYKKLETAVNERY